MDFEDSFLYDGEKQLKIRFNPKVNSFKKNLLEAKVDTIGSQYPFIFKNGNVDYKEFPISGLISRLMDEQNLFKKDANYIFENEGHRVVTEEYVSTSFPFNESEFYQEKEYEKNYGAYHISVFNPEKHSDEMWKWTDYLTYLQCPINCQHKWEYCREYFYALAPGHLFVLKTYTSNPKLNEKLFDSLTDEISANIYSEREFKLEVLEWLTNGQPKLFKSPNEGNYLVRLMNVSLSPQDQLGRMLHNFSCTAYEIDDATYDAMVQHKIINLSNNNNKYLKIVSIPLQTYDANWANLSGIEFQPNPKRDLVGPYYAQGNLLQLNRIVEWATLEDMEPGTRITVDGEKVIIGANGTYHIPMSVAQISLDEGQKSTGVLTYAYYGEINDSFSQVIKTNVEEVIGKQIIGKKINAMDDIVDVATQATSFYNIRFIKRPIQECYLIPFQHYELIAIHSDTFIKNYKRDYQNYVILDENGKYAPAPEQYDAHAIYYLPQEKQNVYTEDGTLVAILDGYDKVEKVNINNLTPFALYHFKKPYSQQLKSYLYRKITFIDTEKQDIGKYNEEKESWENDYPNIEAKNNFLNREMSKRTSTNKYLMNKRDFYLYRDSGQLFYKPLEEENDFIQVPIDMEFVDTINFYLKEDIDLYLDPYKTECLYLGHESYRGFIKDMELDSIFPFERYTCEASVNGSDTILDLTDKEIYNTNAINNVTSIFLGVGVYAELFYQSISVEYDLSSNYDLQMLKKELDNDKKKLSKESMLEACTSMEGTINYINEITDVYETYNNLYYQYLNDLKAFLKAKEES